MKKLLSILLKLFAAVFTLFGLLFVWVFVTKILIAPQTIDSRIEQIHQAYCAGDWAQFDQYRTDMYRAAVPLAEVKSALQTVECDSAHPLTTAHTGVFSDEDTALGLAHRVPATTTGTDLGQHMATHPALGLHLTTGGLLTPWRWQVSFASPTTSVDPHNVTFHTPCVWLSEGKLKHYRHRNSVERGCDLNLATQ